MTLYKYDKDGYYNGCFDAMIDRKASREKGETVFFKYGYATQTAPPSAKDGYKRKWNGSAWEYEEIPTPPEPEPAPEPSEEDKLRWRRQEECFSVVDRGSLWYSHLTDSQLAELNEWYEAWLNVTETLTIPTKPSWL